MTGTNFSEVLSSFVRRIEKVEVDIDERKLDRKEIYKEAKEAEIDVKALRKIVAERRMDAAERAALYETLDQYRHALGMLADTALGVAAAQKFRDSLAKKGMIARTGKPGEGADIVITQRGVST